MHSQFAKSRWNAFWGAVAVSVICGLLIGTIASNNPKSESVHPAILALGTSMFLTVAFGATIWASDSKKKIHVLFSLLVLFKIWQSGSITSGMVVLVALYLLLSFSSWWRRTRANT